MTIVTTLQSLKRTFEDKRLIISSSAATTDNNLSRFKNISFVCEWGALVSKSHKLNTAYDNNCCFSHLVGLPLKQGQPQPMFEWQKVYLFDNFNNHKYNWVKKATGIGASEFTLRYILYQCLVTNEWNGGIVAIATGPNISLAKRLIARAYDIIAPFIPEAKITDYKLMINGCEISAFPGKNMDSMRSFTNVKLVVLEEADFFSPGEQIAARTIAERYIGKSDTSIIMLSTPGAPNGLYQQIEEDGNNSIYNKIYLPYTIGLGTIFTKEEIAKAMQSFSFASEYDLQYLGKQGNVYNLADIATAQEDTYSIAEEDITSRFLPRYMSIDPAWGSSEFAILIAQWRDSKLEIIYENSISRPSFSEMVKLIQHLLSKYPNIKKCIIDSSSPGLLKELKVLYGDPYPNYEKFDTKKIDNMLSTEIPKFVPFNYTSLGKQSLKHSYKVLNKGLVRISPQFNMLITGLKTAVAKGEWDLDKSSSNGGSYQDIVDCFRQLTMILRDRG